MIRFSLIIPVYNASLYLKDCLDSLTKQGFDSNYDEVLIIDDGSTDNSAKIAKRFCEKYNYFKLISKTNGGVSSARNAGLKLSRGKYVAFLDADDFVTSNLYLNVVKLMDKLLCPCFYFGFSSDISKIEEFDSCNYYKVSRINSVKAAVWRYVYLKQHLVENNLFFDETIKYGEDYLFNYQAVIHSKSDMYGSSQCCLFYRLSNLQATDKIKKKDKKFSELYCSSYSKVCNHIKYLNVNENDECLKNKALSSQMYQLIWGGIYLANPKTIFEYFKNYSLSPKDIKVKVYEGSTRRLRFKSWLEYRFKNKFYINAVYYCLKLFKKI